MGILVTERMGFLLTATMGFLFTMTFGIQFTVSKWPSKRPRARRRLLRSLASLGSIPIRSDSGGTI